MSDPPPKNPGGLSLYRELLAPKEGSVISAAPVRYDTKANEPEAEVQKKNNAAFQQAPNIKRPAQKKGKHKVPASSLAAPSSSASGARFAHSSTPDKQPNVNQKLSYSEFLGNVDEDQDEDLYAGSRNKWQGRGGKKKKNKKKWKEEELEEVDWDAIYDPAKPTILARYRDSTEQDAERAEWTDFLHYHRELAGKSPRTKAPKPRNAMFAPPSGLSFAPPSFNDDPPVGHDPMDIDDEYNPPPASMAGSGFGRRMPPPSFAPATVPNDATGEDAYMRRLRMSGTAPQPAPTQSPASKFSPTPPAGASGTASPAGSASKAPIDMAAKKAEAQAKLAAVKAKIEASAKAGNRAGPSPTPAANAPNVPPVTEASSGSTISKAPVRYNLADHEVDAVLEREEKISKSDSAIAAQSPGPDQGRSKMPGQSGFGARMMAKMGWEKGQGLGAKGEGITTALVAQSTKRKKRSDQDGGGWAAPRNMGKIVGGKKRKVQSTDDDEGQFGIISSVIKLQGMLDELDVAYEIEENNLLQEIGEEFSKNYGAIERLYIWREHNGGKNEVFVKFTNQLSALKAVNGTDAMTFAGNPVAARFFDAEKFEAGEYA